MTLITMKIIMFGLPNTGHSIKKNDMTNALIEVNEKKILSILIGLSLALHAVILLRNNIKDLNINFSTQGLSAKRHTQISLRESNKKKQSTIKKMNKPITKKSLLKKKIEKSNKKIKKLSKKKSKINSDETKENAKFSDFIKSYKTPQYPRIAKRRNLSGKVILSLIIDKD
jgi:hypothetical protein